MREDRTEETTEPEKTLPMEKVIRKDPFSSSGQGTSDESRHRKKRRIPHSKTGLFSFRKRNDVDSRIRDLRDKRSPGDVLFSGEEEKLALLEEEYELRKPFAEGGQGELYQGFDRKLHRLVAVKSLHRKLSDDPRQRSLFLTEARVTAQLDHPSIVPIYTLNTDRGNGLNLAMKLIHGETLREYLTQIAAHYRLDGVHSFDETKSLRYRLEIFLKVCDALEYAHNRNVMHGDLKPANIMIGEYHETYIMDWGVARRIRDENGRPMRHELSGTPRYLAPEALAREPTDQRSDIFAMGAILFETVFLKPAFSGNSVEEVTTKIVSGETERFEHRFGASVDGDLKAVIRKALAPDPEQRYRQIRDLSGDLRRYLMGFEVSAKRDGWAMKLFRYLSLHRQIAMVLVLSALLLGTGALAYTLYQSYQFSEQMRERENALSVAYSACTRAGYRLDEQFLRLDQMTRFLAADVQFLLDYDGALHSGATASGGPLPCRSLDEMRNGRFPTMIHSEFHHGIIDPSALVFSTTPDTDRKRLRLRLTTLSQFLPRLLQIILASPADAGTFSGTVEERKAAAFRDGTPIIRVLFGFSDGLYLAYPASGAFPKFYDPRRRPWYRIAMHDSDGGTAWTKPYPDSIPDLGLVISCSAGIAARNRSGTGVCSIDISLTELIEELRSSGNRKDYVEEKAIVDSSGRIIVSTTANFAESEMRRYLSGGENTATSLENRALLAEMNKRKFGVSMVQEPSGQEAVYAFCHIRSVNWFYLEKRNLEHLLAHCRQTQK